MALVLSLREGNDVYIGNRRFFVSEIGSATDFWIYEEGSETELLITEIEAIEIVPGVLASSGGRILGGATRLVLDAPRDICILRGNLKRAKARAV
ncbi:MAG: hypothetical protein LC676_18325 [Loktanella sp.]|nr:hypothetical protein [Loktanella sp.]